MFIPLLVTDFLRRALKHYGKKVGVVDGEKRFTYAQFGERVNRLSNGLLSLGIKSGDRVAVIETNTHCLLEMYYGVPQIGAILLPINIRLSAREVAYILNDSEAKLLMVSEDLASLVEPIKDELRSVEKYILMRDGPAKRGLGIEGEEYEQLLSRSSPVMERDFELDENDAAEMFYTSGTTGRPKGMLHTHRQLYINAIGQLFRGQVTDHTVYLHAVPLFHANAWGQAHIITAVGGRQVMLRRFRPEVACELIQREKVTYFGMAPAMANILIHYEDIDKYDLSSVKRIVIGGAPMSQTTQEGLMEKFPESLVFTGYGLSETASIGTAAPLKDYLSDLPEEEKRRKMRKTGFDDFLSQVRVVNENGEDIKPDEKELGEVIIRGNHIIDEYWKLPEETEKTIVDGWLRTGDIATIDDDGYIQIVDRAKDLIISGGENIGSIEIEDAICSHPAVLEAVVVAAPHEKWGETPAALVVLREGQSLTEEELIAHCRTKLAGFKIPRIVEFRDSLPKGGTGKILKSELKEKFWLGRERRVA